MEKDNEMGTDVRVRHPNRQAHKDKEVSKSTEGNQKNRKDKTATENVVDTTPHEIYGVLSKDMLKELAEYRSDCCITIILPTHRSGMEVNEQQDLRLFKSMIQDVKKELEQKNSDASITERLLQPAYELMRNDAFWHDQSDGLAIFIADGFFRFVKLPFRPEQECIVNNAFYLINLVRLLNTQSEDEFFLLLMRREKTKLYKADAKGMQEVPVEGMPDSISSVINYDEPGKEYMETETGENTDTPEYINVGRPDKIVLGTYVEKIDSAFQQQAPTETSWPLLLAGQSDLVDAFRKTSKYTNVFDTNLEVTEEPTDSRELFKQAKSKIEERTKHARNSMLEIYYNSIATPLTNSMPETVIPAAYYSQVRTLFVERGAHIWGSFDAQNNRLDMHAEREPGDDCLLEKAAIQTILHGGEVFVMEKEKMPKGATIAALLRY